jgi:glycine cleavage system H protein
MSKVLDGLKYTKQHEWIKIEGDIAIVGITDFAQHSLGDIVYLETKDIGEKVEMGESIGTIESVKAAEDIYSPIGGTIAEKNEELISSPEKINKDPYGSWIIKLKNFNIEDLNQLMTSEEYKQYIDSLEQE